MAGVGLAAMALGPAMSQHGPVPQPTDFNAMRIAKEEIPVKFNVPGATTRQIGGFGEIAGVGQMAGEYFTLGAGVDIAPLLKGLERDLCQSPHWGYLIAGEVVATFGDGREETVRGGDLFYWPPGHTVRVTRDAELVIFSPLHEHGRVLDHLMKQLLPAADLAAAGEPPPTAEQLEREARVLRKHRAALADSVTPREGGARSAPIRESMS